MSDIFISYARRDRETAQRLATALEAQGWSVWWDTRLNAGEVWDEVIGRELAAARCVIVLWSNTSVQSHWVREEARKGLERRILVPLRIENVELPLPFGEIQTGDLIDWKDRSAYPGFKKLMADVAGKIGPPPSPLPSPDRNGEKTAGFRKSPWPTWLGHAVTTIKHYVVAITHWRPQKWHLAMGGGIALLVFAAIIYFPYKPPPEDPKPTLLPKDRKLGPFETNTHGITAEVTDFFMAGESARLTIRVRAEKKLVSLCMDPAKSILVDERTGQEWKAASFSHSQENCLVYMPNESRTYWMSFHIGEDLQTTYTALIPGLAEPIKRLKVQ